MSYEKAPDGLAEWFGDIDIYLFDQLLKGRVVPGRKVLEVGCGSGRNLVYLLRSGYQVFGVDESAEVIGQLRVRASQLAPDLRAENFRVEHADSMSFGDASFDVVLSIALLHFGNDERHFLGMLHESWRVLKPEGIFFARLASDIGIEDRVEHMGGRRYRVPDGRELFLVDEQMLLSLTEQLGGSLLEPIKTTNVQNQRCMTTWVIQKGG